jgi:hypothetical protein
VEAGVDSSAMWAAVVATKVNTWKNKIIQGNSLTLNNARRGFSKMTNWSVECILFLTWSCYGHKN